jgi:quercetin dioxygenase-like cupin family protein
MTDKKEKEENMNIIRELSERKDVVPLTNIAHIVSKEATYDCLNGSVKCLGLLQHELVSVMIAELSKNCTVVKHTDTSLEVLVVIDGEIFQETGDKIVTSAKSGEAVVVGSGVEHLHYCVEPTKLIAISVPSSKGYPNV